MNDELERQGADRRVAVRGDYRWHVVRLRWEHSGDYQTFCGMLLGGSDPTRRAAEVERRGRCQRAGCRQAWGAPGTPHAWDPGGPPPKSDVVVVVVDLARRLHRAMDTPPSGFPAPEAVAAALSTVKDLHRRLGAALSDLDGTPPT